MLAPQPNVSIKYDMERKEAYRLFYLVKGHLDTNDQTAFDCADGYFKRLWYAGANGAPIYEYEENFEKEWRRKLAEDICINIQIEKLA